MSKPWKPSSLIAARVCVLFAGCGLFGEDEEEPEKSPTAPRLVGRIASVHEKEGFALVQGFNDLKLGEGLLLSTVGEDDSSATLVVTGERSGRYAAADLKSGEVKVGDAVYARPVKDDDEPSMTPAMPSGSGPEGVNPQKPLF